MSLTNMELRALEDRVTKYLLLGGHFNPELMDADKVRDLIIDLRDALYGVQAEITRLRARAPDQWACPYCGFGLNTTLSDWQERAASHIDGHQRVVIAKE